MIEYEQIRKLPEDYIIRKIGEFLSEDMPFGDVTTNAILGGDKQITAILQAEEDLIFCGEELLTYCFEGKCEIGLKRHDSDFVKSGDIIALIKGSSDIILTHERVMLNLLQRL